MWLRGDATAVLFTVAACSHGALEPGAGSDPGTRTGMITVGGGLGGEYAAARSTALASLSIPRSASLS